MRIVGRFFATGLVLVVCAVVAAFAHKPVAIGGTHPTFDQPLWMEEIDVSQVAYADLSDAHRALWLAFAVEAGTRLDLSLGVPVIERLVDYRPDLAVLGPGLPPIDLPFEVPPNSGGMLFETSVLGAPDSFHEPFTGTDSWILLETSVDLPESGTYYIVAWPSSALAGKLWVAVGVRERFGLNDLLSFPTIVRDVRAFHEVAPRSGSSGTAGKLLFLGLTAALIGWLAFGTCR
jgi:hypothetical protein